MQHEHRLFKLHRIHGAVGATRVILDDIEHAGAAKAVQHLGAVVPVTALGQIERMAEQGDDLDRQGHQFLFGGAHPLQGFMGDLHELYLYKYKREEKDEGLIERRPNIEPHLAANQAQACC